MHTVRLFPDWDGPWPLWEPGAVMPPGPDAVSSGLTRRLTHWWQHWHDHYLPGAGWDEARYAELWLEEGKRLADDIRYELGPSFQVNESYASAYSDVVATPQHLRSFGPQPRRSPYTGDLPVDADGRVHIRLGPEYGSIAPLLRAERDERLSPNGWGISPSLQARLTCWNHDWEQHLAPRQEWDDELARERWESAVPSLVADVQSELGHDYVVSGPSLGR